MFLYLLTNRSTGLVYVGATTLSLARRMSGHRRNALIDNRQSALCAAIRLHGWKDFDLRVLETPKNEDELMRLEQETIKYLNTLVPNGYNMTSGGPGMSDYRATAKTKALMRAARLGKSSWNKGIKTGPISEATKQKQRERQLGRRAWNKGIPATPELKAKLSALRMGGGNPRARAIEFNGHQYVSIADAERATGLTHMQMKYRLKKGIAVYLDTPHMS